MFWFFSGFGSTIWFLDGCFSDTGWMLFFLDIGFGSLGYWSFVFPGYWFVVQSTSDTKVRRSAIMGNCSFALIFSYGIY